MLKKIQKRVAEHCPLNLVWENADCCYLKKKRLNYVPRTLHIVEITLEITNVLVKEINKALYKWYSLARESLVPINGPMFQEEAAEIAKQLAKPEYAEFKASSGWLEKWKNAYGISQRSIEGESGEAPIQTIEAWMERLPDICRGYKLEDIWDMDESGCFFVHCQTDVFRKKGGIAREASTQKFV